MKKFDVLSALVIILLSVISARCQVRRHGRCPNLPVTWNFDATRYLGRWYEQENFPFAFDRGQKCITADYSLNLDGTIRVVNSGVNQMTGMVRSGQATARVGRNPFERAKLSVSFPQFPVPAPYWILDTDYKNFALVWSCTEVGFERQETAWILTRNPRGLDDITTHKLKSLLASYGVDVSPFERTDQSCITPTLIQRVIFKL